MTDQRPKRESMSLEEATISALIALLLVILTVTSAASAICS